jgi:hypothetical protein
MSDLLTVHVVSWVCWHGGEQTSGGFDWYYDPQAARDAFAAEKAGWVQNASGTSVRVRLIEVTLDLHPARVDAETITRWIDDRIDLIEDFRQTRAAGDTCRAVALITA